MGQEVQPSTLKGFLLRYEAALDWLEKVQKEERVPYEVIDTIEETINRGTVSDIYNLYKGHLHEHKMEV